MTEYECMSLRLQIALLSSQTLLLQAVKINGEDLEQNRQDHLKQCKLTIDMIQKAISKAECCNRLINSQSHH